MAQYPGRLDYGRTIFQEEDLDSQQGVIDFSLYLRTKRDPSEDVLR